MTATRQAVRGAPQNHVPEPDSRAARAPRRPGRSDETEPWRALGNQAVGRLIPNQLAGSVPGDDYEQQAQRIAAAVTRRPAERVQPSCRKCEAGGAALYPTCEKIPERPMEIQRAPISSNDSSGRSPPALAGLGAGRPLDGTTRAFFERRFDHDFGRVRVHADARAARTAAGLGARAFTVGRDVVFGAGAWAPDTPLGQRLIAHELTHVVQQQRAADGGAALIQRELVSAGGYPNRFRNDEDEIRCFEGPAETCKWSPSSIDFQATATHSGGGTPIGTFVGLLDHIASRSPGSITELGLIGHANSAYFGLSGTISAHDVVFADPGVIGAETIAANTARIEAVRDRFAAGAQIVLYGCNAGVGLTLLEALSRAFHVCVSGFSDEIFSCFIWEPKKRRAGHPRHIIHRGNVWTKAGELDPLPRERPERCAEWHSNVRELPPDRQSCVGVPAAAPPVTPAGPQARRWSITASIGAELRPDLDVLAGIGIRRSLRSDALVVFNPVIGLNLLYGPAANRPGNFGAALAEIALRIQQPVHGAFLDVAGGGFVGFETEPARATAGLGAALGAGWRWERLEVGVEARALFPLTAGDSTRVLVTARGAWRW